MSTKNIDLLINNADLLSFDDFKIFALSQYPGEKAEMLCKHLKKYMIIKKNNLYIINSNEIYAFHENEKKKILQYCSKYIEMCFENLKRVYLFSNDEDIRDKFTTLQNKMKAEGNHFKNAYIDAIHPQITHEITNNDIIFDYNLDEIHFINGYKDLKTLEFKKRDRDIHFVTTCINRNYEPSTENNRNCVSSVFDKIYTDAGDFECIKMIIGSGLSGRSKKDCDMLFCLGSGSGGKSLSLQYTQQAIDCYFEELNSTTFSYDAKDKADKIMNTFDTKPYIRIAWVNEFCEGRMNESLFKQFCEGELQTTKLFKDSKFKVTHMAKPVFTANTMPNFKPDDAMRRRINAITHKSTFVDDENDCNPSKHIYLKDKDLLENIKNNNGLKNAWFDILAESCSKWLNGAKIVKTANFTQTKADVCLINDDIQDLIDSQLTITGNIEDRIGKITMSTIYKNMFPNKMKTPQTLLANLKDKKILYDGLLRSKVDNIRGCYIGVKQKSCDPFMTHDIDEDDTDYYKKYQELMEENKQLKKQLNLKNIDNNV